MKYMLLIYMNETAMNASERDQCMADSTQLCHQLQSKGQFRGASPLHPVSAATSIQVRAGKRLITDGPFAETHEQLGGYYLIDVANLDEAIEIAGKIPGAKVGTVEIRPIFDLSGLPMANAS